MNIAASRGHCWSGSMYHCLCYVLVAKAREVTECCECMLPECRDGLPNPNSDRYALLITVLHEYVLDAVTIVPLGAQSVKTFFLFAFFYLIS